MTMVPRCPDCMGRQCPSLSDSLATCPERQARNLTARYMELASTPDGRLELARTLAECVIRLDALEKHIAENPKA